MCCFRFVISAICLAILVLLHPTAHAQLTYPHIYIEIDSIWQFQNLRLIPMRFKNQVAAERLRLNQQPVINLSEALKKSKIDIKEFYYNGDANVKLLQLKNKSNQYILLNSGDIIAGGKQDRMLAESKLLAPKATDEFIDVYCVEKGRWSHKNKSFTYIGNADEMLRRTMDSTNSQHWIWAEIENRLPDANKWTTTWPYTQVYQKNNKAILPYVQYFGNKWQHSDSSFAGFIALGADSSIISCEVFASPALTIVAFPQLVAGWAQSVISKNVVKARFVSPTTVLQFASPFLASYELQKSYLQRRGKAYYYKDQLFHLVVHGYQ